jgi:hypothetical protein
MTHGLYNCQTLQQPQPPTPDLRSLSLYQLQSTSGHFSADFTTQDVPRGGPNRGNGHPSMPALVMGNMAKSATYEGALAIAASDSLPLNRGGRGRVAVSSNLLTTRTGSMRGASRAASYGTTMQPVSFAGEGAMHKRELSDAVACRVVCQVLHAWLLGVTGYCA